MRRFAIFVTPLIVVTLAFGAQAAELMAPGKDDGGSIRVPVSETHRNLYVAGGTVSVNGKTTGDLLVVGGTVSVDGDVEQDLGALGGTIDIVSNVGGDLRVAGGTVTIRKPVAGDLLVAGGTVVLLDGASVGGDLLVAGGTVTVDGAVHGSLRAAGGDVTVNGHVDGSVQAWTDSPVVFGAGSTVTGTATVYSPDQAVVKAGSSVHSIDYHQTAQRSAAAVLQGLFTIALLVRMLALALVAVLLVRYLPHRVHGILGGITSAPWSKLGLGVAMLIGTPIVAVLLLVTGIGYYLALLVVLMYALSWLLSIALAAIYLGGLVWQGLTKAPELVLDWRSAVAGVVLFRLLGLVPIIGWLGQLFLFLLAFGAFVQFARHRIMTSSL